VFRPIPISNVAISGRTIRPIVILLPNIEAVSEIVSGLRIGEIMINAVKVPRGAPCLLSDAASGTVVIEHPGSMAPITAALNTDTRFEEIQRVIHFGFTKA